MIAPKTLYIYILSYCRVSDVFRNLIFHHTRIKHGIVFSTIYNIFIICMSSTVYERWNRFLICTYLCIVARKPTTLCAYVSYLQDTWPPRASQIYYCAVDRLRLTTDTSYKSNCRLMRIDLPLRCVTFWTCPSCRDSCMFTYLGLVSLTGTAINGLGRSVKTSTYLD